MNSKAVKRLRREMRVILNIDPRECMYSRRITRSGRLDQKSGLFRVPVRSTISLTPGCGRHLYREAKRQTVPGEYRGHE